LGSRKSGGKTPKMAPDGILHVQRFTPNPHHRPRSRPARGHSASWCVPEWEGQVKELGRRPGSIAALVAATLQPRSGRSRRSQPSFGFGFAHCGFLDGPASLAGGSDTTALRSACSKKRERLQTRGGPTHHSDAEFATRHVGLGR
jgi:hypothetical protein